MGEDYDEDEDTPPPPKLDSEQKKILWGHLKARRTESARNLLVSLIKQIEASSKKMMFRYIQQGVAERGVSVVATKNIIDAVKGVWLSVNRDLEEAKSNIEELFYLLPMDSEKSGWFIVGDASTLGQFVQESLRGGLPELCQVRWVMRMRMMLLLVVMVLVVLVVLVW